MRTKYFICCPQKNWCSKESFKSYESAETEVRRIMSVGERYFICTPEGILILQNITIPK